MDVTAHAQFTVLVTSSAVDREYDLKELVIPITYLANHPLTHSLTHSLTPSLTHSVHYYYVELDPPQLGELTQMDVLDTRTLV
jgi:hypothetical protein